jgi:7-carboxy-7-deazaguanine synthase
MKVTEIFESLQGEGPLMGRPMLFIRLAGCNLSCEWCDTKFAHDEGSEMDIAEVVEAIEKSELVYVCWTGGEPLLQLDEIMLVIKRTMHKKHCLETNGTQTIPHGSFNFVIASPKNLRGPPPSNADFLKFVIEEDEFEEVVKYVNMYSIEREKVFIQPLTFKNTDMMDINRAFWKKCVREGFSLSPRLHILFFGNRRGV